MAEIGKMNGGWSVMLKIGLVLLPIICIGAGKTALDVAAIKSNRFTARDGLEVWQAIADIKTEIAGLPTGIYEERIKQLDVKVDRLTHLFETHVLRVEP